MAHADRGAELTIRCGCGCKSPSWIIHARWQRGQIRDEVQRIVAPTEFMSVVDPTLFLVESPRNRDSQEKGPTSTATATTNTQTFTQPSCHSMVPQHHHHLTKFAFLLSSARSEGSDVEPVVGLNHDIQMAACFSSSCRIKPLIADTKVEQSVPCIASSSLSMHGGTKATPLQGGEEGITITKESLLDKAALNMATPFFTTPTTATYTAKTILMNIITTFETLIDSRLRSVASQIVLHSRTSVGENKYSKILLRLLSPSLRPVRVATVITRFMTIPENENDRNELQLTTTSSSFEETMLSITLSFKVVLDIKVFGEVSTIELSCPVTISGTFDIHDTDGLLTSVDIVFDTDHLLRAMIDQARLVVKLAVTKAAATSVNVVKLYNAKREPKTKTTSPISKKTITTDFSGAASAMSLNSLTTNSLLGSSVLLETLTSLDSKALGSLFSSFSTISKQQQQQQQQHQLQMRSGSAVAVEKGVLRESSYGLRTNTGQRKNSNSSPTISTANATFDLKNDTAVTNSGNITTVRFQLSKIPSPSTTPITCNLTTCHQEHVSSTSTSTQPSLLQQPHSHQQRETSNGNVHAGLFSWLQNDSMFLTDDKIEEANVADVKRELARSLVPMTLQFFTAATDAGDLRYHG